MSLALDWMAFGIGVVAGAVAAALYFVGLAMSVRLALRHPHPVAILLPSAALRIAALLGAGWWVAGLGASALAGFALAFIAARFPLLATLQPVRRDVSWN